MGSDKNKSKVAKKTAKGNVSGTTPFSNNAIQNANDLSKVNKHNLRDYDNHRELITTILFTKTSLTQIQDQMRNACIKSYNKFMMLIVDLKQSKKAEIKILMLKEMDKEYLVSYVNMRKYPTVLFVMAKVMEMNSQEQNQIAMYLINAI